MLSATSSISLRTIGTTPQSSAHDHFEIVWGFEGLLEVDIGVRTERIVPGNTLVIAPRQPRRFVAPRGARCFVVDADATAHHARLMPLTGSPRVADAALTHLLRYMAARPVLCGIDADMLLASLDHSREAALPACGRPIDEAALRAWIDEHLGEELDVAALAARVHLSPTQFAARCAAELGVTPMALVRAHRLAAARRLRSAGMPVAEVARRCGYRSPSALTAALKRETTRL